MELFVGALTMLGQAGAAVGTTAATAVGAAGGASTFASIMSFGGTALGALAEYGAAQQQASALEGQAQWEDFRAKGEMIQGEHQAAAELKNLNADMGKLIVAGYASGLQGSGSVEAAQKEAQEIGEYNVSMARDNAAISAGARSGQAQQLRQEASSTKSGGIFSALGHGFNYFSRSMARG